MRKEKLQAIKMKAGRHARGSLFGRAGEERSDETERAMSKVIIFRQKGDWKKTRDFLKRCSEMQLDDVLDRYGQEGVEALARATPKDTGKTAASWSYRVTKGEDRITITWSNSNIVDGVPIAVILQYGHGTRNGGYVEGVDYINPAMRPIFDRIAARAWGEVRRE